MPSFKLVDQEGTPEAGRAIETGLGPKVLFGNVKWFTRIRWIVVAILMLSAFLGELRPAFISALGVRLPATELWVLAGVLMLMNILFGSLVILARDKPESIVVRINIWLQIIVDLSVLTVLVQSVGSTTSFMPFVYLFHIVLACIFFSRTKSLLVTALAAFLYLSCVWLELHGQLERSTFFFEWEAALQAQAENLAFLFALSAVLVWLVVWYLVSSLARVVQERDQQLAVANRELMKADREKTRQMLRTTHDLKAPFSGIESNVDLIRFKYWDEIPEGVQGLVEKIEMRSQTLRERIREILMLGELKSSAPSRDRDEGCNIRELLEATATELNEKASERGVSVSLDVPPAVVKGDRRSLSILFANIVSNAIVYSKEKGEVRISGLVRRRTVDVSIADDGIGIKPEALPHIFEEYYHTQEAIEFNHMSTGLGLAIVKTIALREGIGVAVDSTPDKGTTFVLTLALADS